MRLSFLFISVLCTPLTAAAAAAATSYPRPGDEACHAPGSNRICNPDGILSDSDVSQIQREIVSYQESVVLCHGEPIPIQLGIYIESHSPPSSSAKTEATRIHDEWGVGMPTACGGSGLLLYLAVLDRKIYISRGSAMVSTLPDSLLNAVIDDMKPLLRKQAYGAAIQIAVSELTQYVRGEKLPPKKHHDDDDDSFLPLLIFFIPFGWILSRGWKEGREKKELDKHLNSIDMARARALQGQYRATSCPICLEDFRTSSTPPHRPEHSETAPLSEFAPSAPPSEYDDNKIATNGSSTTTNPDNLIGSDGKPLKLLQCGHVFDQSCWDSLPPEQQSTCPICRRAVARDCNFLTGEHVNQEMYYEERRYRLERLQRRYPNYIPIGMVDDWSRPDYNGSTRRSWEAEMAHRREIQAQQRSSNSGSSGGSFGGGSSGGGGVGGSW